MMMISQIRMTRPSEMSRYLLMMAATMSVPPVEPLLESPSPTPQPQKAAPITAAMNGWSLSRWVSPAIRCAMSRAKVSTTMP